MLVANWYQVKEISKNVFWIKEPDLVSFYLFKYQDEALFIDSGLGLSEKSFIGLCQYFSIKKYSVICTHAHSDHIGLNAFAEKCFISVTEWEKFLLQGEDKQLGYFLADLEKRNCLPSVLNKKDDRIIGNLAWKPTQYLTSNEVFTFHDWSFQIYETPGHTSGSLVFYEQRLNFIFVGDLVYNGTMYLHLKDSFCKDFLNSLNTLIKIIEMNPGIKIWPAHNGIPLESNFVFKTKLVLNLIIQKKIQSIQMVAKNEIFEEGQLFIHDSIKIITRSKC